MMDETEVFKILASADRQILLQVLASADETATEKELSRIVAAQRHDISPEAVSEEEIKRARIRLVHKHLPKLLEQNVIEQDGNKVALTDGGRDQWIEAAKTLGGWPPDERVQSSTS